MIYLFILMSLCVCVEVDGSWRLAVFDKKKKKERRKKPKCNLVLLHLEWKQIQRTSGGLSLILTLIDVFVN